jgi:phosphoglycerol transferase MdoB-like AlkP superfamily enzyme
MSSRAVIALSTTAFLWVFLSCSPDGDSHKPTTTHAFSVEKGGRPRLFFVNRGRSVQIRVKNDGYLPWEPDKKFRLGYHWLANDGSVAEWNGVRSGLPAAVAPGETTELTARIKMPEKPGLYRLQWDMVQEGVLWFSRVDPSPEPARWALVLPRVEIFATLLGPTCVALALLGLWAQGNLRKRWPRLLSFLAFADLIWCAAALVGKPVLFYSELPARFLPTTSWRTIAAAAVPLIFLALVGPRFRPWLSWLTAALASLLIWGQMLYLRFFGDVATSATMLAAHQTRELLETIQFLAGPNDWWLGADLLVALLLVSRIRGRAPISVRLALSMALLALSLPILTFLGSPASATAAKNLRTLRNVRDYGVFGYQLLDFASRFHETAATELNPEQSERLIEWLEGTADLRKAVGPWAGKAEGFNLIAIQVESMQQFVLAYEVNGVEITPNLNRLTEDALVFPWVQDQTGTGRSSAGDFVSTTGLLPVTESVAYEHPNNDYRTFAHALAERGYTTLSAIPYKGFFWNRHLTHPAYGFSINLFRQDFVPGQRVGWGTNDRDFLRQMLPRLNELPQPFCAWLTTLSLHYPFRSFPAEMKAISLGELEDTPLGNYLHGMNLFDRAFGEFYQSLEDAGLLGHTVIALWGDHESGLMKDQQYIEMFDLEFPSPARLAFRRVPFLVWVPGSDLPPGTVDVVAGQVDIPLTLLALLGVDPAPMAAVGRNLLGQPGSGPVVHPRGWWVSSEHIFQVNFEDPRKGSCWLREDLSPLPDSECAAETDQAQQQIEASRLLLRHDLQAELSALLRERLGNATGEQDSLIE